MSGIRIVLADDHALVRAGIRELLQHVPGFEVVGEADNAAIALKLVEQLRPEIILMDIAMPGMSGIEATAQIKARFPETRVVMLSMHVDQEYVLHSLRAGAVGYLLKGSRTQELELAITAVMAGDTYLSPAASKHLIEDALQRSQMDENPSDHLTLRQRQVLKLIAQGYSRRQIAERINLSAKTVDTYRAQLMEQLNIHDVAGLVRYAIKLGLIESEHY